MGRMAGAAALVLLGGALSGCFPLAMEVAQRAWEARSTQDQVRDAAIHTGILNRMMEKDPVLPLEVRTDVWEGRVLLTGKVNDLVLAAEVEHLARQDENARAVYNRIHVAGEGGAQESLAGDVWIEAQAKVLLLAEDEVRSVNYRWQVFGSQVYIIGRAGSARERDAVLRVLRRIRGVRGVHDFIEVRPLGAPIPAAAR
jgi:osmotically-inducible protein OsmY